MRTCLALTSVLLATAPIAHAGDGPLRPPSVPLVTHDPYFSVWSPADHLTDADTTHWTGKPQPLSSLVRIDGKTMRLMGKEPATLPAMPQTSLEVTATSSVYTFTQGAARVELRFLSPLLPDDLALMSRPATYITWNVSFTDGTSHDVELFFDAPAMLAVNTPDQPVAWSQQPTPGSFTYRMGIVEQPVLGKVGDDLRIDWGYAYVSLPGGNNDAGVRLAPQGQAAFVQTGTLEGCTEPTQPRPAGKDLVATCFAMRLGKVSHQPVERTVVLAYDDEVSLRYFDRDLQGYWRKSIPSGVELIVAAWRDEYRMPQRAAEFDRKLFTDLERLGGTTYARIATLAYRQTIAGCKLVADANGAPLLFPRENFSNGCVGTVDVIYPMAPLFLALGPDLAKAMLVPVMDYGSSPRWKFPFAPHDLGTYPHATGQVYGGGENTADDQMPVEESGNLLLLAAAVVAAERDGAFAKKYWPALTAWAAYLKQKGLDPENQLCTDDFLGHLAHNVNLSAKAILALGAYAQMAAAVGDAKAADAYNTVARDFSKKWVMMADDGDHTRLAFDKPGTWSQKYNLVWDQILDLKLFPQSIKTNEVEFYKKHANPFGTPLDSRGPGVKVDWLHWVAILTNSRADIEALIEPYGRFVNQTPDRVPLCDWVKTDQPRMIGMIARPVLGGIFIPMIGDHSTWERWYAQGVRSSVTWAPLPLANVRTLAPTAVQGETAWKYTAIKPADGWFGEKFEDSTWKVGAAGFGTKGTPGSIVRTTWNSDDLWIRRSFALEAFDAQHLRLLVHHDEDAEIYLNGVLAASLHGYTTNYMPVPLAPEAAKALRRGTNTIAAHVHQTSGGQYIDAGLIEVTLEK